ncbi:stalk domain-containing protein [Paenibacillus campinasensis]|nr:stalk domain-containing protein [Paenibacillus campinasensis]
MTIRNKKLASTMVSLAILGSSFGGVSAVAAESVTVAAVQQSQYQEVNVTIDGKLQQYPQSAILHGGSTLVPLRGVFEALNAEVKWDNPTQTVTATKGDTTIVLTIGNTYAHINGQKVVLAKEAMVINGSTMVPLRFVAEALGAKVEWNNTTRTAIITQGSIDTTNPNNVSRLIDIRNSLMPIDLRNGTEIPAPEGKYKEIITDFISSLHESPEVGEDGKDLTKSNQGGSGAIAAATPDNGMVLKNSGAVVDLKDDDLVRTSGLDSRIITIREAKETGVSFEFNNRDFYFYIGQFDLNPLPLSEYIERQEIRSKGIDATETNRRLYGSANQREYETVLKLAKEALVDIDSIEVPKAMTDYLYHGARGKEGTGHGFYNMELRGFHNQLSPLLEAGISADTIVLDYKLRSLVDQLIKRVPESSTPRNPIISAYQAMVDGIGKGEHSIFLTSLVYDLAGIETRIIEVSSTYENGVYSYLFIKLDDQWIRGMTPIGSDIETYKESIGGSFKISY